MLTEGPLLATRNSPVTRDAPFALIGPHAVIHSVLVMREYLGEAETNAILANAQIAEMPTGAHMIPEIEVLRLHRWLELREPVECFAIAAEAARRTADYIIANRIPALVSGLLPRLPVTVSAHMLMAAVRRHAWTFVGAGKFNPAGAWQFAIDRSGAEDPILLPEALLSWYAKVFERLYARLVSPDCSCALEERPLATPHCYHYRITRA
jgi:divinyl protochlorophyllide a 8-vinyl-reductase